MSRLSSEREVKVTVVRTDLVTVVVGVCVKEMKVRKRRGKRCDVVLISKFSRSS